VVEGVRAGCSATWVVWPNNHDEDPSALCGGSMKRNLLAALSANTFFVVSCGGTDPAEAYIEIANKANCGLAEVAAW